MNWLSQNWIWIVVAVAFLFLMRRGGLAGCGMGHSHGGGHREHDTGSRSDKSNDPVSGREVDTQHAITAYYGGRVFYFESPGTRQRFEAAPGKYAGSAIEAVTRHLAKHFPAAAGRARNELPNQPAFL